MDYLRAALFVLSWALIAIGLYESWRGNTLLAAKEFAFVAAINSIN